MRTAEPIQGCFREEDIVARIGGDEFAVVIRDASPEIMEEAIARVYAEVSGLRDREQRIPLSFVGRLLVCRE